MRSGATSWRQSPAWRPLAAAVAVVLSAANPAAGQTARRVPAAPSQPAEADVRSLVRAMEMQLRLVYRDNLPEHAHRSEQLRTAISAWQASPRTAADQREMTAWLRQSIRRSMPGSTVALPPAPAFAPAPRVAAPPATGTSSPGVLRRAPEAPPATQPMRRETAKATVGGTDIQAHVLVRDPEDVKLYESQSPSIFDRHPAADRWPLDLSEGDPFVDDPLPE